MVWSSCSWGMTSAQISSKSSCACFRPGPCRAGRATSSHSLHQRHTEGDVSKPEIEAVAVHIKTDCGGSCGGGISVHRRAIHWRRSRRLWTEFLEVHHLELQTSELGRSEIESVPLLVLGWTLLLI